MQLKEHGVVWRGDTGEVAIGRAHAYRMDFWVYDKEINATSLLCCLTGCARGGHDHSKEIELVKQHGYCFGTRIEISPNHKGFPNGGEELGDRLH